MECRYYQKLDNGRVECTLCPHHCRMAEGKTGVCRSRRNQGGVLVSEVYGKPCALAIDPIEKKPLYHFHPGTTCLSLACTGCNFRCLNCQNHDISQAKPEEVPSYELQPEALIELCRRLRGRGSNLVLRTNLTGSFEDDMLRALAEAFDQVVVSVDGNEQSHDARRGKGSYQNAVLNCERYAVLARELPGAAELSLACVMSAADINGPPGESVRALGERLKDVAMN